MKDLKNLENLRSFRNLIGACCLLVALALYVASLFTDAFCFGSCAEGWIGWATLLSGPLALMAALDAPGGFCWLANPAIFGTLILLFLRQRWAARLQALAAVAFSSAFIFVKSLAIDESGNLTPIAALKPGYWFWVSSMAIACLGVFIVSGTAIQKDALSISGERNGGNLP